MATATLPVSPVHPAPRPDVRLFADLMLALGAGRMASITGLSWGDYEYLLGVREAHGRKFRVWYDRGRLEVVTTTNVHEFWKKLLAALLEAYASETRKSIVPGGSMTVEREDLDRGFEPDESYHIQSAPRVFPVRRLDFTRDPPPDLTIEIEFTRSAIGRLGVYAAFGVPEVWRYDGTALTFLHLQPDGTYQPRDTSLAFPELTAGDLVRFVRLADTHDYLSILRQFRDWVRQTLPPPAGPTP